MYNYMLSLCWPYNHSHQIAITVIDKKLLDIFLNELHYS